MERKTGTPAMIPLPERGIFLKLFTLGTVINCQKIKTSALRNTKTGSVSKFKQKEEKMRGIKILCTALAVIFVICANLPAQGGIKGGFASSEFYSVRPIGIHQNWISGFQIGLFVDIIKPSPYVQIRPELLYIRKGTERSFTAPLSVHKIKIDYLELPVLVQVNVFPNKTINPYIIGGPYVALRTWAKRLVENTSIKEDIKDLVEPWDFGLVIGIGADYKIGRMPDRVLLEIRYEWGMTDIHKGLNRAKNSSWVFSAGVGF